MKIHVNQGILLYIPLRGIFSLHKNSVYILFKSLKWFRDFSLKLYTVIVGSVETFLHTYA